VPPYAIVVGNPARIIGYATNASRDGQREMANPRVERENHKHSAVRGVQLKNFPMFEDMRGALSVGHFEREVPFHPSRYFLVFDVPSKDVRGEHAHKVCEQFLICVKGSLRVVADDGENREAFVLDRPGQGLYLPAMTWASQYAYSKDAVLLVFASHDYDPDDYIRDYGMFQSLVGAVEMG
jgi:dTDP-4-dehydrorhamnose 3,5-epimerase-like enzyme